MTRPGALASAAAGPGALVAVGAGAVALGSGAALRPQTALAATVAVAVGAVVVRSPRAILGVLLAAVFLEIVTVGGVTISRVVAPLALLITLIVLARGEAAAPRGAAAAWAGAYAVWALASGLWTVHFRGTLYLLGSLAIALAYMLAFATLVRDAEDLRRTIYALSLIALPVSIYAMATFFSGVTLRSSAGKGDPNSFAAYELIGLPLVIVAATSAPDRRLRTLFAITAVAVVGAVMTTLSRGGLVTLLALVLLLAIVPARAIFGSRRQKAVVGGALLASAAVAFAATGGSFSQRLQETLTHQGSSGSGRLDEWKGALTSIGEHPIVGLGYGTFPSVSTSLLQRTPGVDLADFTPSPQGDLAHSAYLETLAELGVPGLVCFLGVIVATALSLRSSARKAQAAAPGVARAANALLLALAAWAVSAVFLSLETARPLWILVGLSLALRRVVAAEACSPRRASGRMAGSA